jgi:hypothetical protein
MTVLGIKTTSASKKTGTQQRNLLREPRHRPFHRRRSPLLPSTSPHAINIQSSRYPARHTARMSGVVQLFFSRNRQAGGTELDLELPASANANVGGGRDGFPVVRILTRLDACQPQPISLRQRFEVQTQFCFLHRWFAF